MKPLILAICLSLSACQTRTVVSVAGKPVLSTDADFTNINFHSGATSLTATSMKHSPVIAAKGTATNKVIRGTGAAVGEGAAVFVKKGL